RVTMRRVSFGCLGCAPVAGVTFRCRALALFFGDYKLIALSGLQREPAPLVADDVALQDVFEVAVTQAVLNLTEDSADGAVDCASRFPPDSQRAAHLRSSESVET